MNYMPQKHVFYSKGSNTRGDLNPIKPTVTVETNEYHRATGLEEVDLLDEITETLGRIFKSRPTIPRVDFDVHLERSSCSFLEDMS